MKTMKKFLSMAALLFVGAILTDCSSEENIDNPQQPTNKDNIVTLTASVGFEANAKTRAVDPSTGVKTFEGTNQIAVIYKNTSNQTMKAVSTDFTPSADGKNATFTVTLTNPATNSNIRYIYPATLAKEVGKNAIINNDAATIDYYGIFNNQNGDLTTLGTNYDLAVYNGRLLGTDLPASATLTNPLAICKFTLTDGSTGITSNVNSLTISDGTNAYTVTPSGLSAIYVAMKPVTSGNICFTANTASKNYTKTASGKTLEASKLYPITLPMTDFTLATPMTLEALTGGTIVVNEPKSGMQYSKNGGQKTAVTSDPISVNAGEKVAFYGSGTSITSYSGTTISASGEVKVYGNIMSLVDEEDFATNYATLPAANTFSFLFSSCNRLKDASGLLLPATTLKQNCYEYMFYGCTGLTTAPKLPATALINYCYYGMFYSTSLIATPKLPASTLVPGCYYYMFISCTSLTAAYVKAGYTAVNSICRDMFDGCSSTAVMHTTSDSKESWETKMGSDKTWSTWTVVDDWTD